MSIKQPSVKFLALLFFAAAITGCAEKKLVEINASKLAEYSDRRGQATVKLYMYSGEATKESIKVYAEKLGCKMLYAYFYPDTVPLSEIPVEEIRSAKSFAETQDILFSAEGYTRWRFASRCFAMIPIITDCNESPASQHCR